MTIVKHEWKMNLKTLIIWTLCVGLSCMGCILLFNSVADSMEDMAQTFAEMGSFSAAFGMDKISIATIEGFYATEISIIFMLGAAMFAAMLGTVLLSKEEEGHTAEFLYTLPWKRGTVLAWKYIALLLLLLVFNGCCILMDVLGFVGIGAEIVWEQYVKYHLLAFLMQLELGSICFLISALCRKKQIGLGLGISVFLYLMDVMCRIVPDLDFLKYLTPYYYANAASLYSGGEVEYGLVSISVLITVLAVVVSGICYEKRDLAA